MEWNWWQRLTGREDILHLERDIRRAKELKASDARVEVLRPLETEEDPNDLE